MYYLQFEDESFTTTEVEKTLKEGLLTTRTQKGDWRARKFNVTNKTLQILDKRPRQDLVENILKLSEIDAILYPVSLESSEPSFDLPNKSNYPATFGIKYTETSAYKSKKVIAYAINVEECRKWVSFLRNVIGKYKDGSLEEFVSLDEYDTSSLEDSGEARDVHKMTSARVYNNKKKMWEERDVKLDNGVITFCNAKGKMKDEFHIRNLIEFGYPSQVNGSQNPPSYVSNLKCLAMRFRTSLIQTSNITMYIHHAEDAKNWRAIIKSTWSEMNE